MEAPGTCRDNRYTRETVVGYHVSRRIVRTD